jgi:hypothetical protein
VHGAPAPSGGPQVPLGEQPSVARQGWVESQVAPWPPGATQDPVAALDGLEQTRPTRQLASATHVAPTASFGEQTPQPCPAGILQKASAAHCESTPQAAPFPMDPGNAHALGGRLPTKSSHVAAVYPCAQASAPLGVAPVPLAPNVDGQASFSRAMQVARSPNASVMSTGAHAKTLLHRLVTRSVQAWSAVTVPPLLAPPLELPPLPLLAPAPLLVPPLLLPLAPLLPPPLPPLPPLPPPLPLLEPAPLLPAPLLPPLLLAPPSSPAPIVALVPEHAATTMTNGDQAQSMPLPIEASSLDRIGSDGQSSEPFIRFRGTGARLWADRTQRVTGSRFFPPLPPLRSIVSPPSPT